MTAVERLEMLTQRRATYIVKVANRKKDPDNSIANDLWDMVELLIRLNNSIKPKVLH